MYDFGSSSDLREGQSNSLLLKIAEKNLDGILEDFEPDTKEEERKILKLQDYNIWNIHENGNLERQMTVEFEKYLLRVSEIMGGMDIGSKTVYEFYCLNEMLQEKSKNK